MQTWEKLWICTTCKGATLTNAKWDAELAVNRTYLLAQSPPQDSERLELAKAFKFGGWCASVIRGMEHICSRLSGWESLSHVSPHWEAHHYKEGIFIRIF